MWDISFSNDFDYFMTQQIINNVSFCNLNSFQWPQSRRGRHYDRKNKKFFDQNIDKIGNYAVSESDI